MIRLDELTVCRLCSAVTTRDQLTLHMIWHNRHNAQIHTLAGSVLTLAGQAQNMPASPPESTHSHEPPSVDLAATDTNGAHSGVRRARRPSLWRLFFPI